jgi:hypothetical protein
MHSLKRFRVYPFSAQKTTVSFASFIYRHKGKYVFFVAKNEEKAIVGALIGELVLQVFTKAFTASIMHIDAVPEARMGGYGMRLNMAFEV